MGGWFLSSSCPMDGLSFLLQQVFTNYLSRIGQFSMPSRFHFHVSWICEAPASLVQLAACFPSFLALLSKWNSVWSSRFWMWAAKGVDSISHLVAVLFHTVILRLACYCWDYCLAWAGFCLCKGGPHWQLRVIHVLLSSCTSLTHLSHFLPMGALFTVAVVTVPQRMSFYFILFL